MTQYESIGHVKFYIFTDVPHTHRHLMPRNSTVFQTTSLQNIKAEGEGYSKYVDVCLMSADVCGKHMQKPR